MTKRLFFVTLIIIWVIVLIQLRSTFSIFLDNCTSLFFSLPDIKFTFSIPHFTILTALSILLYLIYGLDENKNVNILKRYWLTLKEHDSLGMKIILLSIPLSIPFVVYSLWNGQKIPEVFIVITFFTILGIFELFKKQKAVELESTSYLFTDEPIEEYSQLNEFQQLEVRNLKNVIEISGKEYLSIALNGSWGSGKTSILKGLKDLLENGDDKENIEIGNCEVVELNLWQARTPENTISELENLFTELFNKVYLNVSSRDLAFFSLLAESVNSGLSSHLNKWLGANETIPSSRIRIQRKLNQVLSHLKKEKLVILIDDLDRTPEEYLNGFLKIICYVTGFENVVTISGINREKILTYLTKGEDISVWADGNGPYNMIMGSKQSRIISKQAQNANQESIKEIVEFRFPDFGNESFLSKIFVVQLELIN